MYPLILWYPASSDLGTKNLGLASGYLGIDEGKVNDGSRFIKNSSPSMGFKSSEKEMRSSNIDYVESAYLKDKEHKSPGNGNSYSHKR